MFFMWNATVCSEIVSAAAMSRFEDPSATNLKTSDSLSVSCGVAGPAAVSPRDIRPNSCRRCMARPGDSAGSPFATASSARRKSSSDMFLRRYPSAPLFTASKRSACSSETVTMMILISGISALITRVASSPDSFGRLMSISTRSGSSLLTCSSASIPSPALPAPSCPQATQRLSSPARNSWWSSTSSTRNGRLLRCTGMGQAHRDTRAPLGCRRDVQGPADGERPFPHALDTELWPSAAVRAPHVEAAAIVLYLDHEFVAVALETDVHARCVRVFSAVAECLLHDAEELDLRGRRQARGYRLGICMDFGRNLGHASEMLHVGAQAGEQASGQRQRSTQPKDCFADVPIHGAGGSLHRPQLLVGRISPARVEQVPHRHRLRTDIPE